MKIFFIVLGITFVMILLSATLINIAKTRQRNSKHQLTGMCHKTGGTTCSTCSSITDKTEKDKK